MNDQERKVADKLLEVAHKHLESDCPGFADSTIASYKTLIEAVQMRQALQGED